MAHGAHAHAHMAANGMKAAGGAEGGERADEMAELPSWC
jgi:hypothetical protein